MVTSAARATPDAGLGSALREYVAHRTTDVVAELARFVAFPSISASRASATDMTACARWLAGKLRGLGAADAALAPTRGPPAVLGRIDAAPGRPTVLFYGHYDVQPPEPLSAWRSGPFAPTVRNGYLYGRGSSDDKGQVLAHVVAARMLRDVMGTLPVNVVFLIEGGEEIGSPGISELIVERRSYLASDAAVISDMPVLGRDQPALTYGLRGDLYLDVRVSGPPRDLHSGIFGGSAPNALRVLIRLLAGLHHADGSIAVPGFLDDVVEESMAERRYMRRFGPDDADIRREMGGALLSGEPGFSPYERRTIRPSLEVAGVAGGYGGPGVKGVIPSVARAKLDVRLVARQDPDAVHRRIFEDLERRLPPGMALETRELMNASAVSVDRRHPVVVAATRAITFGFGRTPAFVRSGGSIPVVSALSRVLRVPTVLMGFALPDDGAHAPNERFSIAMMQKGILTSAAFLLEMART